MKRTILTLAILLIAVPCYADFVFNPITSKLDIIGTLQQTGTFIEEPTTYQDDGVFVVTSGTFNAVGNITVTNSSGVATVTVPDIWVNETGDTMTGQLVFDGVTNDIVTPNGEQLRLNPGGTSAVIVVDPAMGIGTTNVESSIILDLEDESRALRVTRLGSPGADILQPRNGMIAYDSTDDEMQAYVGGSWVNLQAGSVSDIWLNETGDTGTGTFDFTGATLNVAADTIDAITEISSSIRSGTDGTLITGTSTTGECAEFDANGDIIGAGAACGTGSGSVGNSLNGVEFLVLTLTGTLNAERQFLAGTGLTGVDGGAGSGYTVNVDDDYVFNNGDTMTGSLNFSGVASDITTATNEDLTLAPNGTGNIVLSGSLDLGTDICSGLANGGALTTDANGIVVCENDDGGGGTFSGGSGVIYFIPESFTVYGSLAISGTLDANQPASISTNSGSLDYHVLAFASGDSGGDSGASREFNIPSDYVDTPQLQIYYMMETATSGTVEWEGELLCIDDGEELLNVKGSITAPEVISVTVPGTVGLMDVVTISLTDPGCSPGDLAFILISTDANDGTNDTAAGLRYLKQAVFLYQNE